MSWYYGVPATAGSQFPAAVDRALADAKASGQITEPYMLDQAEEAGRFAKMLVDSGKLGDPRTHSFRASLQGHGNPDHEPAPGLVNDTITITIHQGDN